ncbi:Histidinol-phosphate aminotransferase [Ignavibacterium album JCM 16511]|uniref:Histidinol-phosphate aminotransferase n=1 Tax=Ignavibacterium album (strain DSM 19864 / JCM 16511 / NBRC 101810 / Mat9-16) TaxID=945713 RepID=I0AGQ6_IGNAJ|nr:histidinol-phosphate transaminase [Ignavibacterium album]AFH48163.1 Histidinol-phosphate aminotransferase [Ignavibacterium album JCM 16511]
MKNIETLVRKNILNLKPYTSARDIYQDGIFLDANENSFGSFIESDIVDLNRYPDPHQKELRKALSELINISSDKFFFGVGSDEIIDLSIRIFCEPGKSNVIIPTPTYGMYQVACAINDVEVKSVKLDDSFDLDLEKTLNAIDSNTKMIFLCSPNNPTGNLLSIERIKSLAKSFEGIIFLDEAYIDFAEEYSFINQISDFNNVIISRTFSKAWGLAGVRCGYCIADEVIVNLLFKVKAPYTINKLTSNAIRKAIQISERKNLFVKNIIEERKKLIIELSKLNFVKKIFPSAANFLLVEMSNAKFVFDYLNDKKIRVRLRSDDERLKDCLRITIGTPEENDLLIKALMELN